MAPGALNRSLKSDDFSYGESTRAGGAGRALALITQSPLMRLTVLWKYGGGSRTAAAVRGVLRDFAGFRGNLRDGSRGIQIHGSIEVAMTFGHFAGRTCRWAVGANQVIVDAKLRGFDVTFM